MLLTICYKIKKSDYTSMIGLIASGDMVHWKFVSKDEIANYQYTNFNLSKDGKLHKVKGDAIFGLDAIISQNEWSKLQLLDCPDLKSFRNSLNKIRECSSRWQKNRYLAHQYNEMMHSGGLI